MSYPNQFEDQIANQGGGFEPQRQHSFQFRVFGLDTVIPGAGNILEMSVRTAFIPGESSDEIEIPFMNGRVYIPGKVIYDAGSVTFNDYVDKNTAQVIAAWRKLCYNPETGAIGYASVIKKRGEVALLSPDFTVERVWEIHGMWPQARGAGTLDYSASDVVQVEVTFRFDKAIEKMSPVASILTALL